MRVIVHPHHIPRELDEHVHPSGPQEGGIKLGGIRVASPDRDGSASLVNAVQKSENIGEVQ